MQIVGADLDLSLSADLEKCRNNRLSLADSHALALTKQVNGILLITDSELAKSKESTVSHFKVATTRKASRRFEPSSRCS